jgi:hypothetical protein
MTTALVTNSGRSTWFLGVLMLGMTSAALVVILQHIIRRQRRSGGFED